MTSCGICFLKFFQISVFNIPPERGTHAVEHSWRDIVHRRHWRRVCCSRRRCWRYCWRWRCPVTSLYSESWQAIKHEIAELLGISHHECAGVGDKSNTPQERFKTTKTFSQILIHTSSLSLLTSPYVRPVRVSSSCLNDPTGTGRSTGPTGPG